MSKVKIVNISLKEIAATRKKYNFRKCANLLDVDISDVSLELHEKKIIRNISELLSIKYDIQRENIKIEYIAKK